MSPLFAEIAAILDKAEAEADRAKRAAKRLSPRLSRPRADALGQWIHLTAVASGVEHAYSGMEQAFRIIAAEIDGAVPAAEDWHARLCALMFTPVPGLRPAVLPAALRSGLDDLRAFRHRVRNLYGSELVAEVVKEKAARAPAAEDWHARLCALMFTPVPGLRPAVLPAALRSELDDLRAFRHRVRNLYGSELVAEVVKEKAALAPAVVRKVRRAVAAFESSITRPAGRRRVPKRA